MSTWDPRRSQSEVIFSVLKKQGQTSNQRSNKRAGEETADTNPTGIISQASTATITNEIVDKNRNLLTASPASGQKHNTDGLAIKLNWLKENHERKDMSRIKVFFPNTSKLTSSERFGTHAWTNNSKFQPWIYW